MKFQIGSTVYSQFHGKGVVKKIDDRNKMFTYLCKFKGGTLGWFNDFNLSETPIVKE